LWVVAGDVPSTRQGIGRAILFHGELFRSLTAASRSVAPHHNTGLTFWHWNGKNNGVGWEK
jgi:hypothetical protein